MALAREPQLGIFEEVLTDPALAMALEDWQEAKDDLEPIRKAFGLQQKRVRGLIAELQPGEYRCGRFVIKVTERDARHVEFDVGELRRYAIRLFDPED